MRRGSALLVCLMMLTILFAAPVFADRATEDLQSKVLERFDAPSSGAEANSKYEYPQNHRWIVRGSKFIAKEALKSDLVKTWPTALFSTVPDGADYRSLGIQAAFDRKGYNYLEIVPVEDKDDKDGKPVETGVPIPGRVKNLDMWVWGSNYNYYMDVHVRDYRGMTHVLRLGDVNFRGWKNMRLEIPPYVPQEVQYFPGRTGLELIKIVVWTRPEEKVAGFFLYIDQIKVLTDMFETPFDGANLGDPKNVEKIWASSTPKK